MNVSLQRLTVLSLLVHIIFFGITFLALKRSTHFVMPSPYIVSLVTPETRENSENSKKASSEAEEYKVSRLRQPTDETSHKPKALSREEEQHISDRITALEKIKKIEKIVRLRGIISLKKDKSENKHAPSAESASRGKGYAVDNYELRIAKEIQRHWVSPEIRDKDVEAIVSIKIMKDGSVHIKEIEKKSGNPLFDRSVLRAITNASPLTPPPYEMEIGVRFYP